MRERVERLLIIVCCGLAALLLYRIVSDVIRSNPLAGVTIPALPSLSADTNAPAPAGAVATNAAAAHDLAKKSTNAPARDSTGAGTNAAPPSAAAKIETNAAPPAAAIRIESGQVVVTGDGPGKTMTISPPQPDAMKQGTHVVSEKGGTNLVAGKSSGKPDTNAASRSVGRPGMPGPGSRPDMAMMGMGGPSGPGRKPPELAPAIKARVDRIYDSEIFGPVMRPLPMALLGIAGKFAFLRSASGQTGMVKEGEQVGELKLLKIGVNRVLIEQEGEKKELMIFSGYGGETLLPKQGSK